MAGDLCTLGSSSHVTAILRFIVCISRTQDVVEIAPA